MTGSPERPRGFLRSALLTPVVLLSSIGLVFTAAVPPASANSAVGLANNAWLVTELAAQGLSSIPQSAEVSSWERSQIATATTTTAGAAGISTRPKAGGVLGMVLNTVGVLGGLAFMFGGGEDAPELPMPPPTDGWTGSESVGWTNVPGNLVRLANGAIRLQFPGGSPGYIYWRADNCGSGPGDFCGGGYGWASIRTGEYESGNLTPKPGYNVLYELVIKAGSGVPGAATPPTHKVLLAAVGNTIENPNPAEEADPALVPRYIDSTATCMSPGAQDPIILHETTGPFYLDPSQPMQTPEVPDLACPSGTWLKDGKRELITEGSPDVVPLDVPYVAPDWVPDQVERFPECYPATDVMCQLKLFKVNVTPELDCHSYAAGSANPCLDWRTDPNRRERYECRFGATQVALKRCTPYETLFGSGVVTETPTDPDGDVVTPIPGVDPTPEMTPDLGDCVPGWSEILNPWWVFKATACALQWAFVPQTALSARISDISTDLKLKVPFSWFDGFLHLPVAVPASGCPDWRVKIPGPGEGFALNKNVICDSSYTGAIRTARPLLLVFMGSLALWPLIRSTAYAAFPIIKPQPGVLR